MQWSTFKCQFDPPVACIWGSGKFSFPGRSEAFPLFLEVFSDFKKDKPSEATR